MESNPKHIEAISLKTDKFLEGKVLLIESTKQYLMFFFYGKNKFIQTKF